MRVAHVAPYPFCRLTKDRGYHLCEVRQVLVNERYLSFYRGLTSRGHHVILDNGVAEDHPVPPDTLAKVAKQIGATEVILPDIIGDRKATLALTQEAMHHFPKHQRMVVPQGTDADEWIECLEDMVHSWNFASIGVPHMCEDFSGERHDLMDYLEVAGGRYDVHLLGLHKGYSYERQVRIAEEFPWIRGIDTGKAAAHAQNRDTIGSGNYYSLDWNLDVDKDYFSMNMLQLEQWAVT